MAAFTLTDVRSKANVGAAECLPPSICHVAVTAKTYKSLGHALTVAFALP